MLFKRRLTSSSTFFLPVDSAVLSQEICQIFRNGNQLFMLIKILYCLRLSQCILKSQFLHVQPQCLTLCVGGYIPCQLQQLLNDLLVSQHSIEISIHRTLYYFGEFLRLFEVLLYFTAMLGSPFPVYLIVAGKFCSRNCLPLKNECCRNN